MGALEAGVSPAEAEDFEQDLSILRERLLDLLSTLSAADVLAAHNGPTRLINALRNGLLPGLTLAQALAAPEPVNAAIMRWPNLGRRSVVEAQESFRRGAVAHFLRLGWPENVGKSALSFLVGGVPTDIAVLRRVAVGDVPRDDAESARSPEDILAGAFNALRDRDRDVIARRFGLGRQRQTLEEIGDDYRITRERVRQIEAKALRTLRLRHRPELQTAVQEFGDTAWAQLSGGHASIAAATLSQAALPLCPWFRLALELCGLTLSEWLDQYAQRWKQGWAAPWLAVETLEAIDAAIVAAQVERQLPCALRSIAADDPDLIQAIVQLQPGLRIYGGYVVAQHLGARLKRALGLHAVLGEFGRPMEPAELMTQYATNFPADDCTFRDVELVVEQWPHLFLEVTEGVWASVGPAAPIGRNSDEIVIDADSADTDLEVADEPADDDVATLAGAFEADLRRNGPTRLGDILERAPTILPAGRSINSVGPTLLLYKDRFVRGLPGLYALVGQLPSDDALLARPPTYLLQDDVVRAYVLARRAGEDFGAFPLWRPASEVVWCEWARQQADSALFESLMSIIRPDLWPVEAGRRQAWGETARRRGAFRIGFQPNGASVILPPLDRMMAALKVIKVEGRLGWTKGNRILMRRMRDHQSAGLLAVLVALGALEPGEDWQAPHLAGLTAAELLSALDDVCSATGKLHWQTEIGAALMERLRQASPRGWATEEVLTGIVSRWAGGAELLGRLLEPPLSPLEQLLKEQAALDRTEGLDHILRAVSEEQDA